MKLNEFVKNKYITNAIKEMAQSKRISGTFIFEGIPGSGKSEIAKALAKIIVCQDSQFKEKHGEACGVCSSCKKADINIHPDIIVAEPEENKAGSFHIDRIREIISDLYLTPNESDVKVYILEDLQNMTVQAQNAMLKSIEEPPYFAVFIITVSSCDLILETVASRAVKFTMEYIDDKSMRDYLEKFSENFKFYNSEEISKAVRFANGSIGTAIDILKNKTPVYDDIASQVKYILYGKAKNNKADMLTALQQISQGNLSRTELLSFYSALEQAARDILISKIFINQYSEREILEVMTYLDNLEDIETLVGLYPIEKIYELLRNIHNFKSNLDYNINTKLNIAGFIAMQ